MKQCQGAKCINWNLWRRRIALEKKLEKNHSQNFPNTMKNIKPWSGNLEHRKHEKSYNRAYHNPIVSYLWSIESRENTHYMQKNKDNDDKIFLSETIQKSNIFKTLKEKTVPRICYLANIFFKNKVK